MRRIEISETIHNSIDSKEDLQIFGTVNGNIYCEGTVIVEVSGIVSGEIRSVHTHIKGTVTGFLYAQKHVIMTDQAVFHGVLDCSTLVTTIGVEIIGEVRVRPQNLES